MITKTLPRKEKLKRIKEVITGRQDNIIYVDFVYVSMHYSIDKWYKEHFQDDPNGLIRKGHLFQLSRFYNERNFKDHTTLGQERDKLLKELDLYVQKRREN